jgi:16S rRNA C967 or C1407 C5-methylase (RsmB/RsmF family)
LKSSDMVLDMCAAPGSKTSQILEMLSIDFE